MFNAARICVSQLELRSCARGAVTAISCFPSAVAFDGIVPVLSEDDGISGCANGGAIHFLFGHRIKLFELGILPFLPVWEASELASSETSEALFFRGPMRRRVQRAKKQLSMVIVKIAVVVVECDIVGWRFRLRGGGQDVGDRT